MNKQKLALILKGYEFKVEKWEQMITLYKAIAIKDGKNVMFRSGKTAEQAEERLILAILGE